jgi:hypothetical protein
MHFNTIGWISVFCVFLGMWMSDVVRAEEAKPVRLFILSGQSNMAGLNPAVSFTPAINKAFPDSDNVIVKNAKGGEPIRRWYKDWKGPDGKVTEGNGTLYTALLDAVRKATDGKAKPVSVTFVWMQGEADTKAMASAQQYQAAMEGLLEQLRTDLDHRQIGFVIGRLSDFGTGDAKRPGWETVRKTQVELAGNHPDGAWVDTDDLNNKNDKDDLHYTKDGYKALGERFAEKAIELARGTKTE